MATPTPGTMRLHANTPAPKTGAATILRDTPIRPTAVGAAADASPRAFDKKTDGRSVVWGVAALVAVAVAVTAMVALRGNGSATPTTGPAPTGTAAGPADKEPAAIFISSVPSGARIVVNGEDTLKVTPALISIGGKLPGALELQLKGYQPMTAQLTDADVKTGNREFKLARESGPVRLTISGPYPFELVQGSKVLSAAATHHELTLQPGGGSVVARNRDYLLSAPVSVDFSRSQTTLTIPAAGTLAIFATNETCSIAVDGQDLGNPPIPRKPAAAGAHTVALKCADGKQDSQKVTVGAGERVQVNFGK
jgi:hypothetical protein